MSRGLGYFGAGANASGTGLCNLSTNRIETPLDKVNEIGPNPECYKYVKDSIHRNLGGCDGPRS